MIETIALGIAGVATAWAILGMPLPVEMLRFFERSAAALLPEQPAAAQSTGTTGLDPAVARQLREGTGTAPRPG